MAESNPFSNDRPVTISIGSRRYELREQLKYGTNPHDLSVRLAPAESRDLYRLADARPEALSATNVLDIDLGLRLLLPYLARPAVALVKHFNPTSVVVGSPGTPLPALFLDATAADPSATHGTLVTTAVVGLSLVDELVAHPVHVVAAPGFAPEARERLSSDDLNARMRGLRLVQVDFDRPAVLDGLQAWRLLDGSLLVEWHQPAPVMAAGVTNPPPSRAVWEAMEFAFHVALHCRTISAVVARGQSVIATTRGHQSPLDALATVLGKLPRPVAAGDHGQPLVVASDGHFAVMDPVPLLQEHEIGYFVIAGGRADDMAVVHRGAGAGVHVTLTNRRAFRH